MQFTTHDLHFFQNECEKCRNLTPDRSSIERMQEKQKYFFKRKSIFRKQFCDTILLKQYFPTGIP